MRRATAVLLLVGCALWTSPDASAKRLEGYDAIAGVGFVLDGPTLTVIIGAGRRADETRRELYGQSVSAGCGSAYGQVRPAWRSQTWPAGVDKLAFPLGRDISESADGCLLERGPTGSDTAEVFFGPLPAYFFAQAGSINGRPARGVIRFERRCLGGCRRLGPPRVRCARRFRVRCRIWFKNADASRLARW